MTLFLGAIALVPALPCSAQCVERVRPLIQNIGTTGPVTAAAVVDDGRGPALHLRGQFPAPRNGVAQKVIRWDGESWEALGSFWTSVESLAAHNGTLYGAGEFHTDALGYSKGVAAWRFGEWTLVGAPFDGEVYGLASVGGDLLACGEVTMIGLVECARVARWNGTVWEPVGEGFTDTVCTLYDDGGTLYAGGGFPGRVARWDGQSWTVLDSYFRGGAAWDAVGSPITRLCRFQGSLLAGGNDGVYRFDEA